MTVNTISLQLKKSKFPDEAYRLLIMPDKIEIKAADEKGFFAGVNSFLHSIGVWIEMCNN